MTGESIALIISTIITTFGVIYGVRANYLLGREKNKNDENAQKLVAVEKRTSDAESALAQQQSETQERVAQRKAEREQDRKDFESALEQSRRDREADREAYTFQRKILEQTLDDVAHLRADNSTLTGQVAALTTQNDILQREFGLSEADRKHKTAALEAAQQELLRVGTDLINARHDVTDLRRELQVQHTVHDNEMRHINEITKLQVDGLLVQLADHRQRIEQLQLVEAPRNLEITQLRYTLRAVHKKLAPAQVDEITSELLDRGLSYDGLLYPKVDPLLLPMVGDGQGDSPPPPAPTPEAEKVA